MKYLYLALVDRNFHWSSAATPDAARVFHEAGMQECLTCGPLKLFTSNDTPTLAVPFGGLVVGHLFSRGGSPMRNWSQFPSPTCREQVRKHIIQDCWGEYILIQPAADRTSGFTITRSPSASGEVACIYSLQSGSGFIASDISLATRLGLHRRQIDWDFITERLTYPDLKAGRTGLLNIRELLPGCALHSQDGVTSVETVWSPWDFVAPDLRHHNLDQAAAGLRFATERVVKALAEVDESVLLETSGGLDSSIVGVCLRGANARVACCTVATTVPGGDERRYANLIAEFLGSQLHVQDLHIDNARIDFPLPPQHLCPRMGPLQKAIDEVMQLEGDRQNVASYFSGGGGDTVFGYIRTAAPAADAFRERGLSAAMDAVRDLSELHQCTFWKAGRLTIRKLLRSPASPCAMDKSFLTTSVATPTEIHPWCTAPAAALPGDRERIFDLAINQVYRDAVPRAIERQLRMPLLSQPVMEACLKVPCWMWISGGRDRSVARAAFANALPSEILTRRSKGTFMSYLGAVYQKNKQQIRDFLLTGHLQARGILDTVALGRFIEGNLPTRDRTFIRLFDLCMVENWVRQQS